MFELLLVLFMNIEAMRSEFEAIYRLAAEATKVVITTHAHMVVFKLLRGRVVMAHVFKRCRTDKPIPQRDRS